MINRQIQLFESISSSPNQKVVNVSSVPQRSPFRYPGGKTWLVPLVRKWLFQKNKPAELLIEPFAGGGIVSLTAAFENLAKKVIMIEKDEEVAAVWKVILGSSNQWLAEKIYSFELTTENITHELEKKNKSLEELALCTILKNRTFHGGILAKGSGFLKNGEKGKGISSRWYPKTLHDRIRAIDEIKQRISFFEGDAFDTFTNHATLKDCFFFLDPPYTIAGKRLYNCYEIDHERLFYLASKLKGSFMLTYDYTDEVENLAIKYKLPYKTTPMKTTHHIEKYELIISDNFRWWN
jgi:DNA adenine methylase